MTMPILAGYVVPHPPIIIPEIGGSERFKIRDTIDAYKTVAQEIRRLKPDTIIITTPHAKAYRDVCVVSEANGISGDFSMFRAPDVTVDVTMNIDLASQVIQSGTDQNLPIIGDNGQDQTLDHGMMVPLYFIQELLKDINIVRISTSGLPISIHYDIGKMIANVIEDGDRVIWIASGDLSHKLTVEGPYGFVKEGPAFDQLFTNLLTNNQLDNVVTLDNKIHQKAAVCGLGSFAMMFGAFSQRDTSTELLSYEGPFGVGYAVARVKPKLISPHVQLAKRALDYYLQHHSYLPIDDSIPTELTYQKRGVFVSLHKNGTLRGCIGTVQSTTSSIAEEIIHNAIAAASRDYRFKPVQEKELQELEISVDVLFPPEPIKSIEELDVKRYGVIVRSGYRTGLLLPNLDGIDTPEYQVSIALQKASIHPEEPYQMERFEVRRYH